MGGKSWLRIVQSNAVTQESQADILLYAPTALHTGIDLDGETVGINRMIKSRNI